jgi:hypothetical protein
MTNLVVTVVKHAWSIHAVTAADDWCCDLQVVASHAVLARCQSRVKHSRIICGLWCLPYDTGPTPPGSANITHVHLVMMNHLDVGFGEQNGTQPGYINNVLNQCVNPATHCFSTARCGCERCIARLLRPRISKMRKQYLRSSCRSDACGLHRVLRFASLSIASCFFTRGVRCAQPSKHATPRYFEVYFPRAVRVAQELRTRGGPERLVYTTHGWLAHLYTHCPADLVLSNIALVCPSPADVSAFKDAARRGDIVWQAGAFNAQYELAFNGDMVDEQFRLSRELADELQVPRSRVLSLRDVPGTTRALIPLLVRNNISALTVPTDRPTHPPSYALTYLSNRRLTSLAHPPLCPGGRQQRCPQPSHAQPRAVG